MQHKKSHTTQACKSAADFDPTFTREFSFTAVGADGIAYELVPGGAGIKLTFHNWREYVDAVVEFHRTEFAVQCNAIRRGLATVVPVQLLDTFTSAELEAQTCGRGIDLDTLQLLKKHKTEYSGCSASDDHIKYMWQVLEAFTPEQRGKFFTFCWGRSRLPLTLADYGDFKFKVNPISARGSHDQTFPIGHTCFFSIDMPRYTSLEAAHSKILYSISECSSIDADFNPSEGRNGATSASLTAAVEASALADSLFFIKPRIRP